MLDGTLSAQERLEIAARVQARVREAMEKRAAEQSTEARPDSPYPAAGRSRPDSSQAAFVQQPMERPAEGIRQPYEWAHLPAGSIVLGECEDGMPLTLDLNDPRPGSLLISGDPDSGARRLLHALLLSTAQLNTPAQAGIYRISPADHYEPSHPDGPTTRPGLRQRSRRDPLAAHLRQALNPADPEAQQLLVALEGLVVQRRRSSDPNQGPAVLLAIEDLDAFLDCLDEESFARLHALTIHGPRARVWVMVTLDASRVDRIDSRILDGFRTRLLGSIASPALAAYLAEDRDSNAHLLRPGKEFTVAFNHTWLTIKITEETEGAWQNAG